MPDPSALPPGGGGTQTGLIGGFGSGYVPPTHPADPEQGYFASGLSGLRGNPVTPSPGYNPNTGGHPNDTGFNVNQNAFDSNPTAPKYMAKDEWGPASHPEQIPTLQAQLVEAGLLKASDVRPGVWDAASANAYKSALALANAMGGNDTDAIQYLIDNQKLGSRKGGAGVQGGTAVQLTDPRQMRSDYQSAAETLTGGDLPSSEADAFIHAQQIGEMQDASVKAIGGTYTAPPDATAYIKANSGAAVQSYSALQKGLEFYRMLGVI